MMLLLESISFKFQRHILLPKKVNYSAILQPFASNPHMTKQLIYVQGHSRSSTFVKIKRCDFQLVINCDLNYSTPFSTDNFAKSKTTPPYFEPHIKENSFEFCRQTDCAKSWDISLLNRGLQ